MFACVSGRFRVAEGVLVDVVEEDAPAVEEEDGDCGGGMTARQHV